MAASLAAHCSPATFGTPSLFGGSVLNVHASYVTNFSASAPDTARFIAPSVRLTDASFCNVTVEYTHPGQADRVSVETWLPDAGRWNGRFQAVGGGGWRAGRFALTYGLQVGALADGFATTSTDAGVGQLGLPGWALLSPGNPNLHKLNNFANVALHDQAVIGKALINSYYGSAPKYSYFTGCSTGGRMALAIAQRYPEDFDGIAASAPAINNPELAAFLYWPQQVMSEQAGGYVPYPCEILAVTAAAVAACDGLDGVQDGIIARPGDCQRVFDPLSVVGREIACPQAGGGGGARVKISRAAAVVVRETWAGMPTKRGRDLLKGLRPGALLTDPAVLTIVTTNCDGGKCVQAPNSLGTDFMKYFFAKDPMVTIANLTREQFVEYLYQSQYYNSIIGSNDPDLTPFHKAGGKLISMHGLADELLPDHQTAEYYDAVDKITGNVHDFFRYFEVPGMGHCQGGKSGQPNQLMQQLMDWVEKGTAPESTPVKLNVSNTIHNRILCPYPQRAEFNRGCGDPTKEHCWSCKARKPCKKAR
ncbi:uncharacterized protein E0L32_005825 [Thyridium curvatum]|uniref:Carboxylic ester hydrolase n=1 Tax=Thyridium curvatum TaxID=1093900 RepID=A0A507B9Z2_9PEZI|nr:uncharacterized protein E0L32_005825 [Thyridium curvatum]TPX13881.1 hypothetical protein E0L32_005825 [Thyridium curvatum]